MQAVKICDEGAKRLIVGIVKLAAADWRQSYLKLKKEPYNYTANCRIVDCESFFCSAHFARLTATDGREMLARMMEEEHEKVQ